MQNLTILPYTPQLKALFTIIRNKDTKRYEFIFYSERIIRLLIEEALNHLPTQEKIVTTPTGAKFTGSEFLGKLCAVPIVRAGESMEKAVREVCRAIRIGKILIQRDEETALPELIYEKLPEDISKRHVLLLDPMLATGGSVCKAIDVLKEHGVSEEKIIFVNLISTPKGIETFQRYAPGTKIITGFIDPELDSRAYIIPGLGDFGDLYFGTQF
ncbi:MAG: uracil phosphoribosyltransferase [Spirochaetia bacterium]|nr:uracil phosphoribosyltransferase [Spirochaetia bacterium]